MSLREFTEKNVRLAETFFFNYIHLGFLSEKYNFLTTTSHVATNANMITLRELKFLFVKISNPNP